MSDEDESLPEVPEGVLRGIENILEGRTATKEDIAKALKWDDERSE